jgi:hypothetical protein
MIGVETSGNQAGFMRDNNPWNLNTYVSPHNSLPGGHIVNEFGVNVQVFDSVEQGYAAYVNQLKSNPALLNALHTNAAPAAFGTALSKSGWSSGHYANATTFPTISPFTGSGAASLGGSGIGGEVGSVNVPKQPAVAPIAGANIKNFYGYDLTPFNNSTELGKMEQTIKQYVIDPGYAKTIDTKLQTTYGYQTNWWKKIPEVNTVMLYAAVNLDPSNATQQNEFQSMLAQTGWWKTTTSNARYWDEAFGTNGSQGTDPAQANQALTNAQEKVLADANQIGVTLSKQELNAIALTYAKNNYVASGSFGTASGTAAEWLDQAIIDTLLNIQGQNAGKIPKNFSTLAPGQNQFTLDTTGAPGTTTTGAGTPTGLFGISGQLYNGFQQIAQQYMMYNPNNPAGSLLTQKDIMDHVQSALQNYTGSGSSFGSSNLINGAEATFTELMKQQAKQMYPTLAGSIDAGTTPQAYFAPYASTISNMLYGTSANASTINLMDPKWNWAIATPDPKTGVKNPLTLDQVQQKIVTMPQWQQSNNAQQMGTDVTTSLNKLFGMGGT